jgi:ribonuclease D
MTDIVNTEAELRELGKRLAAAPAFGVDTEFLRERTYRAELCLVQVATTDLVTAVDPLAGIDLAPLLAALHDTRVIKVMHAARQDLEVLAPLAGAITPLFDTQIAAALAGFPAQVGYADLVKRLLGVELDKAHTRTDWSRRPLAPGQVTYAHDDVRYLLPLREALLERLAGLGRGHWLEEELRGLGEMAAAVDPQSAWLRLKGLQGLDETRQALARALAAWREERAMARNLPRGWIVSDTSLREIILRVPRTTEALAVLPEVQPGFVKRSGEEILKLIAAAGISDPPPPLARRPRPDERATALQKHLAGVAATIAAELGLGPEVLVPRRDLEALAAGRTDVAVLSGWRREVAGTRLLDAVRADSHAD